MPQSIVRKKAALPIRYLIDNDYINYGDSILHFGCGHDHAGTDLLENMGSVSEYDPGIEKKCDKSMLLKKYDTIISCYVLNCIPGKKRHAVLQDVKKNLKPNGSIFIAVRSNNEADVKVKKRTWEKSDDGFSNGKIFQRFYSSDNLYAELKKYFKTVIILKNNGNYILAQATNIKLPKKSPRFQVGKQMIGCVYIHKSSENIIPNIKKYKKALRPDHEYHVVKYNWLKKCVSFIESYDFDSSTEPRVGRSFVVHSDGKARYIKAPADPWIYHHKWLMVDNNYKGFDVRKNKSHSIKWMRLNPDRKKIGKKSYWEKSVLPFI